MRKGCIRVHHGELKQETYEIAPNECSNTSDIRCGHTCATQGSISIVRVCTHDTLTGSHDFRLITPL